MPIEFRCSECHKLLRTPDETAGKQAKCPECGAVTEIPAAPATYDVEKPFGAAEPSPPGSAPDGASASPFSPGIPTPEGVVDSDNPYQSPGDYQPGLAGGPFAADSDLMAYARSRVSGPAIALIVTGGLGLVAQILALVVNIVQIGQGPPGGMPNQNMMMVSGGTNIFFGFVGIAMAFLLIVGGMKMNKLENYGLSMTAAIVAMIPCFSPCCLLGLPFGIWALVVLSDGRVQAAFSAVKSGG